MERLWAPWRLNYVTGGGDKTPKEAKRGPTGCIFCDKPGEERDSENLIVARGETVYVILNAFPYNNGHLMVVPYRHIASPLELTQEEGTEMMAALGAATNALQSVYRPDGYNVGMNVGSAAGAGIAAHLHLHVVPRWNGDTNFMPVVGDVKVMPEALEQSEAKLRVALQSFTNLTDFTSMKEQSANG
jgi:ATP adenylyltransferase